MTDQNFNDPLKIERRKSRFLRKGENEDDTLISFFFLECLSTKQKQIPTTESHLV